MGLGNAILPLKTLQETGSGHQPLNFVCILPAMGHVLGSECRHQWVYGRGSINGAEGSPQCHSIRSVKYEQTPSTDLFAVEPLTSTGPLHLANSLLGWILRSSPTRLCATLGLWGTSWELGGWQAWNPGSLPHPNRDTPTPTLPQ